MPLWLPPFLFVHVKQCWRICGDVCRVSVTGLFAYTLISHGVLYLPFSQNKISLAKISQAEVCKRNYGKARKLRG